MGKGQKAQQRAIALQAARELLPIMGIRPEMVGASEALRALDELFYTQPQSVAYCWFESANEQQIDLFIDEWEDWREAEASRCPFCRGQVEKREFVFCRGCSVLLSG
jgi:hypothetical protein